MSSPNDKKLCLDKISRLYSNKALYEAHAVEPKTRVELRMLKVSAFIRSTPEWADQLNDEEKCQEWTTQVKDTFNLADKEVEYVFEELKYYALLKENGAGGEELGAIDNLWTINAASNCELAEEFARNAAVLESDFVQAESNEDTLSSESKALVDLFLYPLVTDKSYILTKPIGSPEDSLNLELPRIKPGSLKHWFRAVNYFNARQSSNGTVFDKRELSQLVNGYQEGSPYEFYKCWLPTDFHVNDDGSVTILSYINNLHPVRYAALYQTISKVFAKFVPLLEQVTTDMVHPRSLRAIFTRESCIFPGMLSPYEILGMARKGIAIPEEYDEFIVSGEAIGYNGEGHEILESNGIEYNMTELLHAYEMSEIYTEPVPEPFCPSDRPIKPYSMCGLPLQASVKMASIDLTPENPTHSKGKWQAMGRAEECIFAVGLYFYDVENIAGAKLKFRDPVCRDSFRDPEDYRDFCAAHDIKADLGNCCIYTQKVGEVEIKNGSYICYPNFYQTKMTSFELVDPTRPGHLKYIAFYIVDPAQRLVSTEIVPPQQPHWTTTTNSLDATDDAFIIKKRLEYWHANSNMAAHGRFSYEINIAD